MTQTKTIADAGSIPAGSTKHCGCGSVVEHRVANARVVGSNPITRSISNIGDKMNFLNSKWLTFAVMVFNFYFALQSFMTSNWLMFIICSSFTIITGYSFWYQMEEK